MPELIRNTKKWADELSISLWGKKLGTKESVIDSVEITDRDGRRCTSIESREALRIKVCFTARDKIEKPHFGVAIFRNDGVYCYGPNTLFDGYDISEIKQGQGYFILNYYDLLFAPGKYLISVAMWDKDEVLAYDHHNCCYELEVTGHDNSHGELLNIGSRVLPGRYLGKLLDFLQRACNRRLGLAPTQDNQCGDGSLSVKLLDASGEEKAFFITNSRVKLIISFSEVSLKPDKSNFLWVGIYRDDGIFCQEITLPVKGGNMFTILFPELPLLPGGYKVSLGIWNDLVKKFFVYRHFTYSFKMAFSRQDHGTVYLKHKWEWRLPL